VDQLTSENKSSIDNTLSDLVRPSSFDALIGNKNLKEIMGRAVEGSKRRCEALGHVLLASPPGLGKTTVARIIGGLRTMQLMGPDLDPKSFERILYMLEEDNPVKRVIFVDEFHSLRRGMKENISIVMEDFQLPNHSSVRISPFTLIAATTDSGTLHQAIRDRFQYSFQLEFYSIEDLSVIAKRTAGILNVKVTDTAVTEIARRSRGIPRLTNRYIKILRDWHDSLTKTIVDDVLLHKFGIDFMGLNPVDRKVLYEIFKGSGNPVGITTIASSLQEDQKNVENAIEPYLLRTGLIQKTPRGRVLTKEGMDLLQKLRKMGIK